MALEARLDKAMAMLKEEQRARKSLELKVTHLQERVDDADSGSGEVLEIVTQLHQSVAALEVKVQEVEQLFDADLQQTSGVEAQLHKLEATVTRELGLDAGPDASIPAGHFADAVRTSSAEQLGEILRKVSTPTQRRSANGSADVHAAMVASMSGVMGHETAEAVCEAFAGVIKELRVKVDKLGAADADAPAIAALEQSHNLLRRDLQVQAAHSEKLGQGVGNVLEQLQEVSTFAAQTAALRDGQEEAANRMRWLEETVGKGADGKGGKESELERRHEHTQWLFAQLDQKVEERLSACEQLFAQQREPAEPAVTQAEITETNKAIDDISNAVADDLAALESKNTELAEQLKALGGVQLQELMAAQFATDEAVAEQSVKMSRVESVLKDQVSARVIPSLCQLSESFSDSRVF